MLSGVVVPNDGPTGEVHNDAPMLVLPVGNLLDADSEEWQQPLWKAVLDELGYMSEISVVSNAIEFHIHRGVYRTLGPPPLRIPSR